MAIDAERLARFVRELRAESGLTQAQLADRLNRRQSWVSRVEAGRLPLLALDLVEIGEAVGMTVRIETGEPVPAQDAVPDPAPSAPSVTSGQAWTDEAWAAYIRERGWEGISRPGRPAR